MSKLYLEDVFLHLNAYMNIDAGLCVFNFNANLVAVVVISIIASGLNRMI